MGMAPPAAAINKGLQLTNWMISQWNRKRWLVYQLLDLFVVATGQQTYSVGPGGDISLAVRPDKLEAAFMRQIVTSPNLPVDYPLDVVTSREDYSRIRLKTLVSWPEIVFLDPGLPTATLYSWPVMQPGYEFHVVVKQVLARWALLGDLVGLPEEYEAALYYNMKVRFAASYRIPANPTDVALAKDGLNVVRGANNAISTMRMPAGLKLTGLKYNIYSDNN